MTDQPPVSEPDTPAHNIDPSTMTATDIRRLALVNLAQRAADGSKLTTEEWARLEAFERDEQPDPLADIADDLQAHVDAIKAKGSRPPASVVRLLRDIALRDIGVHVWADVPAAAKELGVSVQTVRNWCDEFGIHHQRAAIGKAELYRSLWLREREQAGSGKSDTDLREQHQRMAERQIRMDERTGRLIAQAQDAARAAIVEAVRGVREIAGARLPARLADTLCTTTDDRLAWEGEARRITLDALNDYCRELGTHTPDQEPTP